MSQGTGFWVGGEERLVVEPVWKTFCYEPQLPFRKLLCFSKCWPIETSFLVGSKRHFKSRCDRRNLTQRAMEDNFSSVSFCFQQLELRSRRSKSVNNIKKQVSVYLGKQRTGSPLSWEYILSANRLNLGCDNHEQKHWLVTYWLVMFWTHSAKCSTHMLCSCPKQLAA